MCAGHISWHHHNHQETQHHNFYPHKHQVPSFTFATAKYQVTGFTFAITIPQATYVTFAITRYQLFYHSVVATIHRTQRTTIVIGTYWHKYLVAASVRRKEAELYGELRSGGRHVMSNYQAGPCQ